MLLERLLENLALTVDAFATCHVAPGWRLRLPGLDWVTFHYVLEGEGALTGPSGRAITLPPGSLAVLPPGFVHSLQCGRPPFGEQPAGGGAGPVPGLPDHRAGSASDAGTMVVACGRLEVTYGGSLGVFDQLQDALVLDFSGDPVMDATFQRMLDEIRAGRPGSHAMISALMKECLISVFRELCGAEDCRITWLRALDDPATARAIDAMITQPAHSHTVASLAATAFMSRSAFARRFRQSLGVTPMEYLRGVRLRYAARLLRQAPPLPIAAIARRSGFASRSQFSRAFREHFGRPPADFRD